VESMLGWVCCDIIIMIVVVVALLLSLLLLLADDGKIVYSWLWMLLIMCTSGFISWWPSASVCRKWEVGHAILRLS